MNDVRIQKLREALEIIGRSMRCVFDLQAIARLTIENDDKAQGAASCANCNGAFWPTGNEKYCEACAQHQR